MVDGPNVEGLEFMSLTSVEVPMRYDSVQRPSESNLASVFESRRSRGLNVHIT
jgi:hypothetical protein